MPMISALVRGGCEGAPAPSRPSPQSSSSSRSSCWGREGTHASAHARRAGLLTVAELVEEHDAAAVDVDASKLGLDLALVQIDAPLREQADALAELRQRQPPVVRGVQPVVRHVQLKVLTQVDQQQPELGPLHVVWRLAAAHILGRREGLSDDGLSAEQILVSDGFADGLVNLCKREVAVAIYVAFAEECLAPLLAVRVVAGGQLQGESGEVHTVASLDELAEASRVGGGRHLGGSGSSGCRKCRGRVGIPR